MAFSAVYLVASLTNLLSIIADLQQRRDLWQLLFIPSMGSQQAGRQYCPGLAVNDPRFTIHYVLGSECGRAESVPIGFEPSGLDARAGYFLISLVS